MTLSPDEFRSRLENKGVHRTTQTIRSWCKKGLPGARMIGGTWEIAEKTVDIVMDGNWRLNGIESR